MDASFLQHLFGERMGDAELWVGAAAGIGMVAAIVVAAQQFMGPAAHPLEERLRRAARSEADGPSYLPRARVTRAEARQSLPERVLAGLSRLSRPTAGDELARVRARLDHAGLRGPHALEMYFGAKIALSAALTMALLGLGTLLPKPVPNAASITVLLAAAGFFAPGMWLRGRVDERQRVIGRALPDTLDLLVTCVEAGLGLEAAVARVVQEVGLNAPLLSAELSQTTLEIRAGIARGEAFRRLAARTGLDELRSLAATLIQTELFGTSIARALRVQSQGMRVRRTQRAEERAATVATRMLIPLILCILPSLFAVIMGPAAVRIVRLLLPSLSGRS